MVLSLVHNSFLKNASISAFFLFDLYKSFCTRCTCTSNAPTLRDVASCNTLCADFAASNCAFSWCNRILSSLTAASRSTRSISRCLRAFLKEEFSRTILLFNSRNSRSRSLNFCLNDELVNESTMVVGASKTSWWSLSISSLVRTKLNDPARFFLPNPSLLILPTPATFSSFHPPLLLNDFALTRDLRCPSSTFRLFAPFSLSSSIVPFNPSPVHAAGPLSSQPRQSNPRLAAQRSRTPEIEEIAAIFYRLNQYRGAGR
mmetsp:Transcript_10386/g.16951  ORF Transcript_10386/g.16951 Transcript_10386/m.16951 type:complete len:259 (-) Transcript_10386:79-855(-)